VIILILVLCHRDNTEDQQVAFGELDWQVKSFYSKKSIQSGLTITPRAEKFGYKLAMRRTYLHLKLGKSIKPLQAIYHSYDKR
jgi:hypothetical protein